MVNNCVRIVSRVWGSHESRSLEPEVMSKSTRIAFAALALLEFEAGRLRRYTVFCHFHMLLVYGLLLFFFKCKPITCNMAKF